MPCRVLRYAGDVYTELILRFAKSINSNATTLFKAKISPWAIGGGKKADSDNKERPEELETDPKRLSWHLTPELRTGIRFAETRLSDLICQNDIVALEFQTYGKSFITRHGFSPDACRSSKTAWSDPALTCVPCSVVQMAFQAAYFSLYGRTECVYEPAMTKGFLHGRTEAIRSVQRESVKFVQTFCSGDASVREKIDALRSACKRHVDLTRECSKGLGQDRLLYAMAILARNPSLGAEGVPPSPKGSGRSSPASSSSTDIIMPAIFRDGGYSTLGHSTLSTSNCGNPCLRLFGFGSVVPDGFGIGYIIKDDGLSICASSKHLQTQRYLDTLRSYLLEVQRMLTQLYREANAKPANAIDMPEEQDDGYQMFGGYDFYDTTVDALDRLRQEAARRRAAIVGTKIAVTDY